MALAAAAARARRSRACPSRALDELDLVAVRILDERDHAAAELHRAGLARDLAALRLHGLARLVDIGHAERDVAEAVAEIVGLRVPVVGELDHRLLALVAVAHEGERELAVGIVLAPQQLHAEHSGVEAEGAL